MSRNDDRLNDRAETLETEGGDPLRVELLRRARRFKRSWVEMAEALLELRVSRAYESWGYKDLYGYCAEELLIKRRTVDKLTGSYDTLKRHAPEVLAEDYDERRVPSFDAVDYFARAVDRVSDPGAVVWEDGGGESTEVVDDLRRAVFEEQRPVTSLRRRFNDVLFTKSHDENALAIMEKAHGAAERLCSLLPNVEGLDKGRVAEVAAALDGLIRDLEGLMPDRRARVEAQAS
ncbi:MAG: hypothetical protein KC731_13380 [Myxococcales bacterium]|nr:hypothetical protein [Myxococcales bacterium]